MALNSQQRQVGRDNYEAAVRLSRRQLLAAGATVPTAAAMYWGYGNFKADPVGVGVIGTGNQGRALIRSINPAYLKVTAFSEIRPSNQIRARKDLADKFGADAADIPLYENYHDLLADDRVELVIVALPLHLHAEATIAAFEAGKHVLCEKLMAKTVTECKEMVRAGEKHGKHLSVGHQRHYSYLYANCHSIIEQGDILGDIKHIRAYWHRNQTNMGAEGAETGQFDSWRPPVPEQDQNIPYDEYGYESLDELIRWRLSNRTGGGLLVELGSHQLDAISIFLGKQLPVAVHGTGVTSFFTDGRDVDDHIFLTYEFPGDVVATYSSICTNMYDGYGEQVMGTRGTMIVDSERDAFLFREMRGAPRDTRINWAEQRVSQPAVDTGSTAIWALAPGVPDTLASRGYREQLEHLAWLIRNPGSDDRPRCDGKVGLDDAVVTLVGNLAMDTKQRIVFKPEWFDVDSDAAPEKEYTV